MKRLLYFTILAAVAACGGKLLVGPPEDPVTLDPAGIACSKVDGTWTCVTTDAECDVQKDRGTVYVSCDGTDAVISNGQCCVDDPNVWCELMYEEPDDEDDDDDLEEKVCD